MRKILRAILFFPSVSKLKVFFLIAIAIGATFFEGFGVAMLYPVMDFIEKGKDFDTLAGTSKMWLYLVKAFDLFGIPKNLLALMSVVFGLLMVRQLFNYAKVLYRNWVSEGIYADTRSEGFKRFVTADLAFYDSHGVGQLINALTVDGVRAGGAIFSGFNLASAVLIFMLYLLFLAFLSAGMTLFALAVIACAVLSLRSRIRKSEKIGIEISRNNEVISSALVERLNGIRLLKLSGTEEIEASFVRGLSESIRKSAFDLARVRARVEFMVDPVVVLAGLVILYATVEIFRMGLAKSAIFIFVLLRLMPYVKEMFDLRQAVASQSGSLTRVIELMIKAKGSHEIRGGDLKTIQVRKGIRFDHVCFSYDDSEKSVLEDLNLSFPAGRMTALVGRSGAGKSTLVDLIPRLRSPQKGIISIDGTSIERFDLGILRRSIAFVAQEEFLFNDTIMNNVLYARRGAPMSEVIEAARMAYADSFIRSLPKGYDTVVGERGVRVSGGERQRIVLARALLQKASIIIMDEPTSSLDSESESLIQKAMEEIRSEGNILMIVIAHRLSTIKNADQIIVLEKGKVAECGSHRDLMHEDNWYADMVRMQGSMLQSTSI